MNSINRINIPERTDPGKGRRQKAAKKQEQIDPRTAPLGWVSTGERRFAAVQDQQQQMAESQRPEMKQRQHREVANDLHQLDVYRASNSKQSFSNDSRQDRSGGGPPNIKFLEDGIQNNSANKRLRNMDKKNRGFEGQDEVGKNNVKTRNVGLTNKLMKPKHDIGLGQPWTDEMINKEFDASISIDIRGSQNRENTQEENDNDDKHITHIDAPSKHSENLQGDRTAPQQLTKQRVKKNRKLEKVRSGQNSPAMRADKQVSKIEGNNIEEGPFFREKADPVRKIRVSPAAVVSNQSENFGNGGKQIKKRIKNPRGGARSRFSVCCMGRGRGKITKLDSSSPLLGHARHPPRTAQLKKAASSMDRAGPGRRRAPEPPGDTLQQIKFIGLNPQKQQSRQAEPESRKSYVNIINSALFKAVMTQMNSPQLSPGAAKKGAPKLQRKVAFITKSWGSMLGLQNRSSSAGAKGRDKDSRSRGQDEAAQQGQTFNYKELMSGDENLFEVVDKGKNLFFDCPPMCFFQVDRYSPEDFQYWRVKVDENKEPLAKESARLESIRKIVSRKDGRQEVIELPREVPAPDIYDNNYSPFWKVIEGKVSGSGKNAIRAAYEGGHRLERRYRNVFIAFTYGKPLPRLDRCTELDDAQYERKLLSEVRSRKPPPKEESVNEHAKIGGSDPIDEDGRKAKSQPPSRAAPTPDLASPPPRVERPARPDPAVPERIVREGRPRRNVPEGPSNKERGSVRSSSSKLETSYEEDSQEGANPRRPCCRELETIVERTVQKHPGVVGNSENIKHLDEQRKDTGLTANNIANDALHSQISDKGHKCIANNDQLKCEQIGIQNKFKDSRHSAPPYVNGQSQQPSDTNPPHSQPANASQNEIEIPDKSFLDKIQIQQNTGRSAEQHPFVSGAYHPILQQQEVGLDESIRSKKERYSMLGDYTAGNNQETITREKPKKYLKLRRNKKMSVDEQFDINKPGFLDNITIEIAKQNNYLNYQDNLYQHFGIQDDRFIGLNRRSAASPKFESQQSDKTMKQIRQIDVSDMETIENQNRPNHKQGKRSWSQQGLLINKKSGVSPSVKHSSLLVNTDGENDKYNEEFKEIETKDQIQSIIRNRDQQSIHHNIMRFGSQEDRNQDYPTNLIQDLSHAARISQIKKKKMSNPAPIRKDLENTKVDTIELSRGDIASNVQSMNDETIQNSTNEKNETIPKAKSLNTFEDYCTNQEQKQGTSTSVDSSSYITEAVPFRKFLAAKIRTLQMNEINEMENEFEDAFGNKDLQDLRQSRNRKTNMTMNCERTGNPSASTGLTFKRRRPQSSKVSVKPHQITNLGDRHTGVGGNDTNANNSKRILRMRKNFISQNQENMQNLIVNAYSNSSQDFLSTCNQQNQNASTRRNLLKKKQLIEKGRIQSGEVSKRNRVNSKKDSSALNFSQNYDGRGKPITGQQPVEAGSAYMDQGFKYSELRASGRQFSMTQQIGATVDKIEGIVMRSKNLSQILKEQLLSNKDKSRAGLSNGRQTGWTTLHADEAEAKSAATKIPSDKLVERPGTEMMKPTAKGKGRSRTNRELNFATSNTSTRPKVHQTQHNPDYEFQSASSHNYAASNALPKRVRYKNEQTPALDNDYLVKTISSRFGSPPRSIKSGLRHYRRASEDYEIKYLKTHSDL